MSTEREQFEGMAKAHDYRAQWNGVDAYDSVATQMLWRFWCAGARRAQAPAPAPQPAPDWIAKGNTLVRKLYNEPRDSIGLIEVGAWIQYAIQLFAAQRPAQAEAPREVPDTVDEFIPWPLARLAQINGQEHVVFMPDEVRAAIRNALASAAPAAPQAVQPEPLGEDAP